MSVYPQAGGTNWPAVFHAIAPNVSDWPPASLRAPGSLWAAAVPPDRHREDFGADCLFRAEVRPGVVASAFNWSIHGSVVNAPLTRAELRCMGAGPYVRLDRAA